MSRYLIRYPEDRALFVIGMILDADRKDGRWARDMYVARITKKGVVTVRDYRPWSRRKNFRHLPPGGYIVRDVEHHDLNIATLMKSEPWRIIKTKDEKQDVIEPFTMYYGGTATFAPIST